MKDLNNLRNEIDKIDDELVSLLVKRMELSKQIGKYKKDNNLPIFDPKREETLKLKHLSKVADEYKIPYEQILDTILKVSKDIQL